MMSPIISVIIPTHNRANLLIRAVQSVLDQTFRHFEVIIVDDASTDSTSNTVNRMDDERISYIRHKSNKGGSAARNTGIKLAKGDYVCFLDDDDAWMPTKLEKQYLMFEQLPNSFGLLYCGCRVISGAHDRITRDVYPPFRGDIFARLLSHCFIWSPTVMMRKSIIDQTSGFDEKLKSLQDWDMWLSVSKLCHADFINEILASYYVHSSDRISLNVQSKIEGKKMFIEKWGDELSMHPKKLASQYSNLGKFYHIRGDSKIANFYSIKSVKLHPFNINNYIILFLGIFFPKYCTNVLRKRFYRNSTQII